MTTETETNPDRVTFWPPLEWAIRIGDYQILRTSFHDWDVFYRGSCIESRLDSEDAARQFITDHSTSK